MNGIEQLTVLVDFIFQLMSQIWTQLVMTNIFLFISAILSLVVVVIRIKNSTTK